MLFVLAVLAVHGCADDEVVPDVADAAIDANPPNNDASVALSFVAGPEITMAPNANAPLVGQLTLATSRATRVTVTLNDGDRSDTFAFDELATTHSIPVLGFRPSRNYTIRVQATGEASESVEDTLTATTGSLPADFPLIDVLVADVSRMEPGVTMFTAQASDGGGYIIMVDSDGEVVWYLWDAGAPGDTRRMNNGNLLFTTSDRLGAVEMTMRGDVVNRWHAANSTTMANSTPVAVDAFHHELFAMDNGNYLVVSSEERSLDNYPTSALDPTPRTEPTLVVGDVIVEFEPDGTIVGSWSLLDLLDPYRVGYDSFGSYWTQFYGHTNLDWAHANAAIHVSTDDTIIVSSRHQDAVVKFERNGDLVWILGPHENWAPPWDAALLTPTDSSFEFQYHQHAPEITPNGTLLLFDNGVQRASPPDPPTTEPYSRALEVAIDPISKTVTEVWSYDAYGTIASTIVGDADWMPATGNVLVDFGGLLPSDNSQPSAKIVEVTHTTPPVVVFELNVTDNIPSGATIVYRVERLSLYP